MFDFNLINKRYFDVKLNDITLEVEPPTLKTLKKISRLSKSEDTMEDFIKIMIKILNKNRRNIDVSHIIENLDQDQIQAFITEFLDWLNEVKNSKN